MEFPANHHEYGSSDRFQTLLSAFKRYEPNMHRIALLGISLTLLSSLPAVAADRTIVGDEDLLQAVIAAQQTNRAALESGWFRGRLEYWAFRGGMQAHTDTEYLWDSRKQYWRFRQAKSTQSDPDEPIVPPDPKSPLVGEMIVNDDWTFRYFPERFAGEQDRASQGEDHSITVSNASAGKVVSVRTVQTNLA